MKNMLRTMALLGILGFLFPGNTVAQAQKLTQGLPQAKQQPGNAVLRLKPLDNARVTVKRGGDRQWLQSSPGLSKMRNGVKRLPDSRIQPQEVPAQPALKLKKVVL